MNKDAVSEESKMDEKELQKTILDYLSSHHAMSLATVDNGMPHAAAVFYINIGFALYFLSSTASRHGIHFLQNPHVSATINEDYASWRQIKGIQMEGVVRSVGSIRENGKIALAFIKKFPDAAHFFNSPQLIGEAIFRKVEGAKIYKLAPDRILFINNEEGFGHRDELPRNRLILDSQGALL